LFSFRVLRKVGVNASKSSKEKPRFSKNLAAPKSPLRFRNEWLKTRHFAALLAGLLEIALLSQVPACSNIMIGMTM